MAFQFSLQPVLRLRAGYERLERLRLHALLAVIVRVREEIAAVEWESARVLRSVRESLRSGMAGAELHFEAAAEETRAVRKARLELQLLDLERAREKQQHIYTTARRKHKILENLRQRRWEEYARLQARREQAILDELHLIHRASKAAE